jgi:hypothetical protein
LLRVVFKIMFLGRHNATRRYFASNHTR